MAGTDDIRTQYEAWPYPQVPLWATLDRRQLWQLNAAWLADRCGRARPTGRPRIWIAGCGTFQPYVIARANPDAEILATDLSGQSLRLARRRCRAHGIRNVRFERLDLTDPQQWPEGSFDVIENYGVLMNLPDPGLVLRQLGEKLTPQGVLRVMVYPHYSRQRVFQLQRAARLLGLTAAEPRHPGLLRKAVARLDRRHALRYAFESYADTKNDAGVVDAFLHAGDRGFSAFELLHMVEDAGLSPAFWFQREWGQPSLAAENLGLQHWSQAAILNYLDLWQELRSNFVVCLVRSEPAAPEDDGGPGPSTAIPRPTVANLQAHPLFDPSHPELGARHRLRLWKARWLGTRLPSKVSEPVRLSAADIKLLAAGSEAWERAEPRQVARLASDGLLLGREPWRSPQPVVEQLPSEPRLRAPRFEVHRRARNPLFEHLFQAWTADRVLTELDLPDLEVQMGRWIPHADPLEARHKAFGLTPYRTYQLLRRNVQEYLADWQDRTVVGSWADVRLRGEDRCFAQVRAWAQAANIDSVRQEPEALRELWVLLFAHDTLFLPLEEA